MKLTKGQRVAFTAARIKQIGTSAAWYAARRGTYQGPHASAPNYCRVIWDDAADRNHDDPEYREMSMTVGEMHPNAVICALKSAAFTDTYAAC